MCGISGIFDLTGRTAAAPDVLHRMADRLKHRGPDGCGFFADGALGFGFRRLSIIDVEGGQQPMFNENGSVVTMCNGEIYNYTELRQQLERKGHHFHTRCDVEVLPHLYEEYGIQLLDHLNGQFALAIYDKKRRTLFLARDHFGVNPLFYALTPGGVLVFASEIKCILEHPQIERRVDLTGLDQVLCFPGIVSPYTMFENIKSLKAGHYIRADDGGIQELEYWDLNYPLLKDTPPPQSEEFYIETLRELMLGSVSARLQSDVPVGVYLSGGLDSSVIGGMAHALRPEAHLQTFSVSFKGREMCEAEYQQEVVRAIQSDHHDVSFDAAEILSRLEQVIYHTECPLKETYDTACLALSGAAKSRGVTVVLTGEGADELFGGYIGYRFDRLRASRNSAGPDDAGERLLRQQLWGDPEVVYDGNYASLARLKPKLYSAAVIDQLRAVDCFQSIPINKERLRGRHPFHQRSYLDFKLRLADHLLADHSDRVTMANSVEGRHPFLDINLFRFVATISPSLIMKDFREKFVLRQAARPFVPQSIIEREKFGWFAPGSPDMLHVNFPLVNELLSYESIKKQGYFNPEMIEELKSNYSARDFWLDLPFESDLLSFVLTFSLFLRIFEMPELS